MRKVALVIALIAGGLFAVPVSSANALSCPVGSTAVNASQCIYSPSTLTSAPNMSTTIIYSCPSNTTINSSNMCVGLATSYPATVTNTSTCTVGDTLDGATGRCVHNTSSSTPASLNYSCLSGTLVGSQCQNPTAETSYNPSASTTTSCPYNYAYAGGVCQKLYGSGQATVSATNTTTYSCPSGGSLSSGPYYTCTVPAGVSYVNASSYYSCASGVTPVNGNCYSTGSTSYNATVTTAYSCPSGGTLQPSNLCLVPGALVAPSTSYDGFCPVGYSVNTTNGNCDAVAFVPNALVTVQASYVCSHVYRDGTSSTSMETFDLTFDSMFVTVTCYIYDSSTGLLDISYLCTKTFTNGSEPELYQANYDDSSVSSTYSIKCTAITTDTIPIDPLDPYYDAFEDTSTVLVLDPSTCDALSTYEGWISCMNVAV